MNHRSTSNFRLLAQATVLLTALLLPSSTLAQERNVDARGFDTLPAEVENYFSKYCFQCHGDEQQKGDRRFDQLSENLLKNEDAASLLEEALDAINRGDMPPKKDGIVQPSPNQSRRVIEWITGFLESTGDANADSTTTLRRLNRFEYLNTLRHLLELDNSFDPTGDFPADAIEEGFDNNGEVLTLSDYQLERYMEVAQAALDRATYFDQTQPESRKWSYKGSDFNGVTLYQRAPVTWRLIVDDYIEIGHGQPSERHVNYVKKFEREDGAPADGWYTISIRASAANRLDHGYDHQEFERFKSYPLKLALWVAPESSFLSKNAADKRRLVKIWDLPDETPEVFTKEIWLEQGAIPFLSWTNGISSKGNIRRVAEKHHPEVIRATKTQLDSAKLGNPEAVALVEKLAKNSDNPIVSDVYRGPRVRVWEMNLEGPNFKQWPPASHRVLFDEVTDASRLNLERVFVRFASRAFRRPVRLQEIDHYLSFTQRKIQQGETPESAIKLGLAAILTSPRFLYLDEGDHEADEKLSQFEIASRLSYFLWSSMPDEALIEKASEGKLSQPAQIQQQVERMLQDDRATAFAEHFTDTWLRINILGTMPPDSKTFESYYRDRLETLFKQETRLFFLDLVKRNGSIVNFLDSDYTFANDALAKHYGIQNVVGEEFQRVSLKPEHHRGGLLGQGSVLTLTANGIETSPVLRGVWVLENIFGTPPSPPPPDVEPLEPDTRGTVSIRDQLNKHRHVPTCADCHQKIDPAGFALEFYDPVGAYRERYPAQRGKGLLIDGSGRLPSGESFNDATDLKKVLVKKKKRFAEALTEKLLVYATGRSMTFQDRDEVRRIAQQCAESGYGIRDLIIGVATSDTFLNR